jgi:hypothetical protein
MFPHILRRRVRRSRTSMAPLRASPREPPTAWRRPLTWVALLTLVASALYFSVAERESPAPEPVQKAPVQVP